MVVIIILAVLTGIAIPSYLALRNRARIQATRSEMQNIATAIAIFEADIGAFPVGATIGDLEALLEAGADPYMAVVPLTDAWGAAYDYDSVALSGTYTLASPGNGTVISITDGAFN